MHLRAPQTSRHKMLLWDMESQPTQASACSFSAPALGCKLPRAGTACKWVFAEEVFPRAGCLECMFYLSSPLQSHEEHELVKPSATVLKQLQTYLL